MLRAGIDVGGTKIEAILIDEQGQELARQRIATPRDDYHGEMGAISDLIATLENTAGRRADLVGAGIPGSISLASGLIRNANSTWLNGKPFAEDLAALLARPVRVQNDANCFALSEAVDGAGAEAHTVFGVILGTGVGGGIAVGKNVLEGPNRIAGEWGHTPLPWATADEMPGRLCFCGRRGCIETWLSGPGMAAEYAHETGEDLDGPAIVALAAKGELPALATLDRYIGRLARGLAMVIDILDPDIIVLGGGLGAIGQLYDQLPYELQRWCFSDRIITPVVPPRFGDSSGVRGAARLWPAEG